MVRLVGVVLSNYHNKAAMVQKQQASNDVVGPASTDKGHGKGRTKEVGRQQRRARPVRTDKRRPAHSRTVEQSVHIVSNESREGECLDTEEEAELEGVQQPHREDAKYVYAHDVRWEKDTGRAVCSALSYGYSQSTQFHLLNSVEGTEFEYFLSCFPCNLVDEICIQMTQKGKACRKGHSFSVTVGGFWLFMGYHL